MSSRAMAAVDLGASSGRVIVGRAVNERITLHEAARFPNGPVALPTNDGPRLHWDVLRLWQAVVDGLREAAKTAGGLASLGVDSWGVDYGLIDARGALLGNPASYRCARTTDAPGRFFAHVPEEEMYRRVGLQVQPFNTVFQLVAESPHRLASADCMLLMPDLMSYWLSGRHVAEVTNTSTTGLLDPCTRSWRADVIDTLRTAFGRDISGLLGDLVEPGATLGSARLDGLAEGPAQVVAVGSHDTASAIVAVPAQHQDFAYISCGTWSLVGVELDAPVLTEEARRANLTNELGVDSTVRFLKNVMGLWVFNEAVRTWHAAGNDISVPELVDRAAREQPLRTLVDLVDHEFFLPGDMPRRIANAAIRTDQPVPESPAQVARCIIDSLALAYRRALREVAEVSGRDIAVVHMVGGGIQNELLCQLTADATGLTVLAGPVEATALGNLAVQARAVGALQGDLRHLRSVVRASSQVLRYEPSTHASSAWEEAERRLAIPVA